MRKDMATNMKEEEKTTQGELGHESPITNLFPRLLICQQSALGFPKADLGIKWAKIFSHALFQRKRHTRGGR